MTNPVLCLVVEGCLPHTYLYLKSHLSVTISKPHFVGWFFWFHNCPSFLQQHKTINLKYLALKQIELYRFISKVKHHYHWFLLHTYKTSYSKLWGVHALYFVVSLLKKMHSFYWNGLVQLSYITIAKLQHFYLGDFE